MSPNAGSQPMRTGVHRSPIKLWRSNSIFNYAADPLMDVKFKSMTHLFIKKTNIFPIFEPFWLHLASEFEKVLTRDKNIIENFSQKFMLISKVEKCAKMLT
jgi:hypothetical protein